MLRKFCPVVVSREVQVQRGLNFKVARYHLRALNIKIIMLLVADRLSTAVFKAWRSHLTKQCPPNTKRLQQLKQQGLYGIPS